MKKYRLKGRRRLSTTTIRLWGREEHVVVEVAGGDGDGDGDGERKYVFDQETRKLPPISYLAAY